MMKQVCACAMLLALSAFAQSELPEMSLSGDGQLRIAVPAGLRGKTLRVMSRSLAVVAEEVPELAWEGQAGGEIAFPRWKGKRDLLFRSWQLQDDKGTPVSGIFHVTQVREVHAGYEHKLLRPSEIKGVSCVVDMRDAVELGARYIHTNLCLPQLWANPETTAVEHEFDGEVFRFNKQMVNGLDHQMQMFYKNGICVFLVFTNSLTGNSVMDYPGTKKVPIMNLTGFNTATPEGIRYFAAAVDFLAARYSRDDAKYGQLSSLVVGNEVQQHAIWYNIGEMPVEQFVVAYAKAVRVAQLAAWNHNPDLRIYISMEHHWTHGDPKSKRVVPGKTFLECFNRAVKEQGDIPWNLAHHPYPENLFNPRFWNDRQAKSNFNTPKITFRNLEQLVGFLKQPDWLYQGRMRDIALTEQGFNFNEKDPEGEVVQAAAYAYGYKQVKRFPEISAFILHRHADHAQEGGLRLGLRYNAEGTIANPGRKRLIWDVFKAAGTSEEEKAFAFALPVIGIKSWDESPAPPAEPKSIFSFEADDLVYDFQANLIDAAVNKNTLDCRQNEVVRAAGWLVKSIFQHPPRNGWSELSYKVKLPDAKGRKLVLAWECMVDNDVSSGVAFHVLIDGQEHWQAVCKPKQPPRAGEVELTGLAEKEITVTFGTEAHGDISGDWANWIQPMLFKR